MIRARLNYLRMMPRKLRVVAKVIRKKSVNEAEKYLSFIHKRAAKIILKLLKSALSNARNKGYQAEELYVKNIIVQEGPKKLRRFYPKARGAVGRIVKKLSHIELILDKNK